MGVALNRSPGAAPRHLLVSTWVIAAVAIGALLVVADSTASPRDDPDPAQQRPGILDGDGLPARVPDIAAQLVAPDQRAVVFFDRADHASQLCAALGRGEPLGDVHLVVVVQGGALECAGVSAIDDPGGHIAAAIGMRTPRDQGPPVGYAVIDRQNRIRYRTLDPSLDLDEARTIVDAL